MKKCVRYFGYILIAIFLALTVYGTGLELVDTINAICDDRWC